MGVGDAGDVDLGGREGRRREGGRDLSEDGGREGGEEQVERNKLRGTS